MATLDLLMMAALQEKTDRTKALSKNMDELTARETRSLAPTGLQLRVGGVEVAPGDMAKRVGHLFEDPGKKLIAHSIELGFWTPQKTASQ